MHFFIMEAYNIREESIYFLGNIFTEYSYFILPVNFK